MEGNRDDSEKCYKIAMNSLREGNKEKALRFLNKAHRLYPSSKVSALISSLSEDSSQDSNFKSSSQNSCNGESQKPQSSSDTTENGRVPKRGSIGREEPVQKPYTTEQVNGVKKILKCKDYYEILNVEKDCNEEQLKRSYKKLALKFHPDKNHAPRAADAFKAINNAFGVLSDSQKRSRYDQYGPEENQAARHHHHHHHDFTRGGFEADVSAEELFNMFFGGGFSSGVYPQRRTFHTRQHNTQQTQESGYSVFLQLAPIIFLVVLSLLSSFLVSDPIYSLNRSNKYPFERKTSNLGFLYYVKTDFHKTFKGSIHRLEREVEEDVKSNLYNGCLRERTYKENMLWRARTYQDSVLYQRAMNLKTPSCDRLQQL